LLACLPPGLRRQVADRPTEGCYACMPSVQGEPDPGAVFEHPCSPSTSSWHGASSSGPRPSSPHESRCAISVRALPRLPRVPLERVSSRELHARESMSHACHLLLLVHWPLLVLLQQPLQGAWPAYLYFTSVSVTRGRSCPHAHVHVFRVDVYQPLSPTCVGRVRLPIRKDPPGAGGPVAKESSDPGPCA
jgi:hypothetical protein